MGISKPRMVAVTMLIALVSTAALAQENAVGGQVRLRGSNKPLGQVSIKVAQMPDLHDTTDDKDGVYVLLIPKSLKKFDLIYEHDNCFRAVDEGILNEQAQNKRPIRELRSTSSASVRALTPEELNEIVDQSYTMAVQGLGNDLPALSMAGRSNLSALSVTGEAIGSEAHAQAERGQVAKAEESYKISLAILEKTNPASYRLAKMLDDYAFLLRKTGRPTLADQQTAKANDIRLQAQFLEEAVPFHSPTRDAYTYQAALLYHRSQFWSRAKYDKFALEHIGSLPNLVGTTMLLSNTGDGQFGRVSVPAKGSADFRIHLEEAAVPVLRILTGITAPFEVEVAGDKGRVKLTRVSNLITWNPETDKTFTITIANKSPEKRDYVVNLSARSSVLQTEP